MDSLQEPQEGLELPTPATSGILKDYEVVVVIGFRRVSLSPIGTLVATFDFDTVGLR